MWATSCSCRPTTRPPCSMRPRRAAALLSHRWLSAMPGSASGAPQGLSAVYLFVCLLRAMRPFPLSVCWRAAHAPGASSACSIACVKPACAWALSPLKGSLTHGPPVSSVVAMCMWLSACMLASARFGTHCACVLFAAMHAAGQALPAHRPSVPSRHSESLRSAAQPVPSRHAAHRSGSAAPPRGARSGAG